jgi:hypothetical protein
MSPPLCRHCERRPAASVWGLCERCDRSPQVRVLYLPNSNRKPVDEAILERLRRRANARLPLFPRDGD